MSSNSSWVPDEDPQTLFSERSWLQGVILSAIAYGVTVSLFFLTFHLLVHKKNRVDFKNRLPLLIYSTASFLLGTLFMISLAAFTQMAFIDDRNYPGGPNAFENNMFSIPVDNVGNAAFVLSNWLSDALVVWRFSVIYKRCQLPAWLVMFFPCLLLAGSVAMGVMFMIQVSTTNPFVTNGINFTVPYLGISLALNIILTIAIVLRLLFFRHRVVTALGSKYGSQYTSIAAMIIESAALYSAVSITFLVLFGIGNAVAQVFIQSLGQFQIIATLLIAFRVAQGKAWTGDTSTYVATGRSSEPFVSRKRPSAASASSGLVSSSEMTKFSSMDFRDNTTSHSVSFAKSAA